MRLKLVESSAIACSSLKKDGNTVTTDIKLRLKCVDLTYDYDFPEAIQKELENDYVINSLRYDKETLKRMKMILLICPEMKFDDLIACVFNGE